MAVKMALFHPHPLHPLQEAVQVQGLRPAGDAEGSKATVWIATMGLQREAEPVESCARFYVHIYIKNISP